LAKLKLTKKYNKNLKKCSAVPSQFYDGNTFLFQNILLNSLLSCFLGEVGFSTSATVFNGSGKIRLKIKFGGNKKNQELIHD
jgi:hypothetical protein